MSKPMLTVKEEAQQLVKDAEESARRYAMQYVPLSFNQACHAFEYGYMLSALRHAPAYLENEPLYVVATAMEIRFGMTDEDFATDILGG